MEKCDEYTKLVEQIKKEYPSFEVLPKETSRFMKALYIFAAMRFWNPHFMEHYITALFGKVYMPVRFIGTRIGYEVLRHEAVHLRDAARWPVLFEVSYLFFPLPCVFTMRAYWEYRAYCETLAVEAETLGYVRRETLDFCVSQFVGSYYLWMCPFPNYVRNKFYQFLTARSIKVKY